MRGQDGPQTHPSLLSHSPSPDKVHALAALRGLRTAPVLDASQRQQLRQELQEVLARCEWFTVGVMAPDRAKAVACLRSLESALGWPPLQEDGEADPSDQAPPAEGTVFLKGNQRLGRFRLREEPGLGEGLLITGHNPEEPGTEDTWGPLPLDLFT